MCGRVTGCRWATKKPGHSDRSPARGSRPETPAGSQLDVASASASTTRKKNVAFRRPNRRRGRPRRDGDGDARFSSAAMITNWGPRSRTLRASACACTRDRGECAGRWGLGLAVGLGLGWRPASPGVPDCASGCPDRFVGTAARARHVTRA